MSTQIYVHPATPRKPPARSTGRIGTGLVTGFLIVAVLAWAAWPDSAATPPPLKLADPRPATVDAASSTVVMPAGVRWLDAQQCVTHWSTLLTLDSRYAPLAWDRNVYVCVQVSEGDSASGLALCQLELDSGRLLWQVTLGRSDRTASTEDGVPVRLASDGDRIYVPIVSDGELLVVAVNVNGRLAWKRSAGHLSENRAVNSPVISASCVLVTLEDDSGTWFGYGRGGRIVALHRQTGEKVWSASPNRMRRVGTPLAIEVSGSRQVIAADVDSVRGLDAESGDQLWRCRLPNRTSVHLVNDGEQLFCVTSDAAGEILAMTVNGAGDATGTQELWRQRRSRGKVLQPVLTAEHLVLLNEDGQLAALDRATGRVSWRKRLVGRYAASPVVQGPEVLCLNDEGVLTVIDWNRRGEISREVRLPAGRQITGLLGGEILVHGENRLLTVEPARPTVKIVQPPTTANPL